MLKGFWFYFLVFSPAVTEPKGCCSVSKGQQLVPARETGVSLSFLSSSLCLSTPAGRVWGKKPPSSPLQLKCVRAENWGGQCGAVLGSTMGATGM